MSCDHAYHLHAFGFETKALTFFKRTSAFARKALLARSLTNRPLEDTPFGIFLFRNIEMAFNHPVHSAGSRSETSCYGS